MPSSNVNQRGQSSKTMNFAPAQQRIASKQRPDVILVDPSQKADRKNPKGPAATQSVTTPWVVCGVVTTVLIAAVVVWVAYWTSVASASAAKAAAAVVVEAPVVEPPSPVVAVNAAMMTSEDVRSPIPAPGEKAKLIAPKLLAAPEYGLGASAIPSAPSVKPAAALAPAAPKGVIAWNQASQYLGQEVTVEGTILDAKVTGSVCQLQFSRNKDSFYVVVFEKAMNSWGQSPEKFFLGKTIQVSGKVTTYRDRPQIRIETSKQVSVVSPVAAAVAPAPAPAVVVPVAPAAVPPTIAWSQATKYIGQIVTVEGTVLDATESRNKTVFLNFSNDAHAFYVMIPETRVAAFTVSPLDAFKGKKIRVTGRITTYQDRAQIKVEAPSQIVAE